MKLETINNWLRWINLVLVIVVDTDEEGPFNSFYLTTPKRYRDGQFGTF